MEEIDIRFDFGKGDIELVFQDKTSYSYSSETGAMIATLFEELIEEAYQNYQKDKMKKERLKRLN